MPTTTILSKEKRGPITVTSASLPNVPIGVGHNYKFVFDIGATDLLKTGVLVAYTVEIYNADTSTWGTDCAGEIRGPWTKAFPPYVNVSGGISGGVSTNRTLRITVSLPQRITVGLWVETD